mmetsp:Transcript_26432/g.80214  ORF Transcript_26432/g.80214 Transcript_26432/m.80214 type:complete len:109 (-) Transcript_26432:538-864(-)|eukprot:scaffold89534_cov27-Tisochrysis_lutea.AAC.6
MRGGGFVDGDCLVEGAGLLGGDGLLGASDGTSPGRVIILDGSSDFGCSSGFALASLFVEARGGDIEGRGARTGRVLLSVVLTPALCFSTAPAAASGTTRNLVTSVVTG